MPTLGHRRLLLGRRSPFLLRYYAGTDPRTLGWSTPRADATTCATYIDSNGVVQTVAANVPRYAHYIGGVAHWLNEPSRANAVSSVSNLSTATSNDGASITLAAGQAPDGTTAMNKLVEAAGETYHGRYVDLGSTATDNATQSFSIHVRPGSRTWCFFYTRSKAGAVRRSWINLATFAVATKDAGHTIVVHPTVYVDGSRRVECRFSAESGASTVQAAVYMSTGDGVSTYAGDGASYLYSWGWQYEKDAAFSTSLIVTAGTALTRAADAPTNATTWPSQTTTRYWKYYDLATAAWVEAIDVATRTSPDDYTAAAQLGRAYAAIKYLRGSRTLAECRAA